MADDQDTLDRWLAAINARDAAALTTLMAPDFVFIDSLGTELRGAKTMTPAWRSYFAMCSDYWIRVRDVGPTADALLLAGEAGGPIDGISWRIPAAWKIVIRDRHVAEWRVFADNKPVYDILAQRSS
jgi:ketosteroid isomerase-like protein